MNADPDSEIAQYALYRSTFRVGDELARIDTDRALLEYEAALQSAQKYVALAPSVVDRQSHVAFMQNKIGNLFHVWGKWGAAQQLYEAALKTYEALVSRQPSNLGWRRDIATTLLRIGDNLVVEERFAEAVSQYQFALSILEALPEKDITFQSNLANGYNLLAEVYLRTKKIDEAFKQYQNALDIRNPACPRPSRQCRYSEQPRSAIRPFSECHAKARCGQNRRGD